MNDKIPGPISILYHANTLATIKKILVKAEQPTKIKKVKIADPALLR